MRTGSFAFSLRLSSVISTVAVAPAGITAPLEPVTELLTVALNRCPTRFVFVQIREFEVRLISEPAGIVPRPRSEPDVPRVTVLPLAVVVGAAGVGVDGRGVVRAGVRGGVLTALLDERVGVRTTGALVVGCGALGVPVAGTSLSCGWAVVSWLAI
jgi:hypothetical protein